MSITSRPARQAFNALRRQVSARNARRHPLVGQWFDTHKWVTPDLRARIYLPDQRRLLVLHVPKTAGSSLRTMLAAHVPADETFLSTGSHEWVDRSMAQMRDYRLFVGHHFLEPLYLFPSDHWVTVLPLREPIAWWRSRFAFVRASYERAGQLDHPMVKYPMGHWVDAADPKHLSNGQSSWLLSRMRLMFDNPLAGSAIASTGDRLRDRPVDAVRLLDRLVNRVTVVGTTDDVHGMYLNTCRAMRWEPKFAEAERVNVSARTDGMLDLTPAQEQRLHDLNKVDQYLYDRALTKAAALTAKRVSREGTTPGVA